VPDGITHTVYRESVSSESGAANVGYSSERIVVVAEKWQLWSVEAVVGNSLAQPSNRRASVQQYHLSSTILVPALPCGLQSCGHLCDTRALMLRDHEFVHGRRDAVLPGS
jgi:hypothetical protein